MRFQHLEHPGRGVRLAYCLNLHAAEDLDAVLAGMERITLPLAERLGVQGLFGVGPWLPGSVALPMGTEEGEADLERWLSFIVQHGLDPFTFNAFPFGGFHEAGLKEKVFRPSWKSPLRLAFTLAVSKMILAARMAYGGSRDGEHLSISTHCGAFARGTTPEDLDEIADNLAVLALNLSQLEEETNERIVVSLEPEPRSTANDTRELAGLFERILVRGREVIGRGHRSLRELSEDIIHAHLGTCLDACHAAVEFEDPGEALASSTAAGRTLGKLQFSSALALARPDDDEAGRSTLLALDEPVYLHQVTASREGSLERLGDLSELAERWEARDPAWRGADEWRCHFHVPVDLGDLGPQAGGLTTTRPAADALLAAALEDPDRWGSRELHLEIETYTWDVLPGSPRGTGDLLDGLEREYAHILGLLDDHGWTRVETPVPQL